MEHVHSQLRFFRSYGVAVGNNASDFLVMSVQPVTVLRREHRTWTDS
jgi:hypothetical protein